MPVNIFLSFVGSRRYDENHNYGEYVLLEAGAGQEIVGCTSIDRRSIELVTENMHDNLLVK